MKFPIPFGFAALALSFALAACGGPTTESVCDKLCECKDDAASCASSCKDANNSDSLADFEKESVAKGCEDEFDDLLSCFDDLECKPDLGDACESIVVAIEKKCGSDAK